MTPVSSRAAVEVAPIFSGGMVVQREMPVSVWGKAGPGEAINVSFAGQEKKANTDGEGRWRVTLEPLTASKIAFSLRVKGSTEVVIRDVLVGDVWLITGCPDFLAVPRMIKPTAETTGADVRVLVLPFRKCSPKRSHKPFARTCLPPNSTDYGN